MKSVCSSKFKVKKGAFGFFSQEIYEAMNETLVKIHNVDIDAVGLGDFGKRGITSLRDKSLPFMNNCH